MSWGAGASPATAHRAAALSSMPQVARRLRAVSVIFPMALGLVALVGPVSRPRPLALDSVYDVSPVTLFIPAESARQASAVLQSLRLRSPAAGDPSDLSLIHI